MIWEQEHALRERAEKAEAELAKLKASIVYVQAEQTISLISLLSYDPKMVVQNVLDGLAIAIGRDIATNFAEVSQRRADDRCTYSMRVYLAPKEKS